MDVFKFLDEAVRGAVEFVYGFARSTLTLIIRPIRGPTHLWVAYRDPSTKQISPITYLALSLALLSLLGSTTGDTTNQDLPGLLDLARLLTTGSLSAGLVPALGGAIVGTIVIDSLLRLIGRSYFKGRRYDKFVAILEYESGLFIILGTAPLIAVNDPSETTVRFWLGLVSFYAFATLLALHFYSLLSRRSRYYSFAKNLPRRLRTARRAGIKAWVRHLARLLLRPWLILWAAAVGYARLLLGLLLVLPPLLVVTLGNGAREFTSTWLANQQAPQASVALLNLQCDLASTPGTVRAAAWNSSSKPAIGWLDHLAIEIRADFGESYPLDWRPTLDPPRQSDLLMSGEATQVRGNILVSPVDSIEMRNLSNPRCVAVGRSGTVRISSEGNAVRLPPGSARLGTPGS